jgi:tetratricopeptide (TPR) repeat protein
VIPPDIEAKQLSPEIRRELTTLDRANADIVARHLVAAGELLDEDPEAALAHARAARARSGRIAAVREAVGIAAYHCGDWQQALAELRAARRMGSRSALLPLIADCERGVGRPERAVELARGPDAAQLTGDDADELRIVAAGARADLGQLDQALALLSSPPPDPSRTGQTAARLDYAYAETLLELGRSDEALQWFLHAAAADIDGVTDAEDRVAELAPAGWGPRAAGESDGGTSRPKGRGTGKHREGCARSQAPAQPTTTAHGRPQVVQLLPQPDGFPKGHRRGDQRIRPGRRVRDGVGL